MNAEGSAKTFCVTGQENAQNGPAILKSRGYLNHSNDMSVLANQNGLIEIVKAKGPRITIRRPINGCLFTFMYLEHHSKYNK